MYRTDSYDEMFSKDIRKPKFAKVYIKSMLEEFEIDVVLILIARRMGTTEFAEFVGERVQNINKFVQGERRPKRETLDKYLKPFGLETVLHVKDVA